MQVVVNALRSRLLKPGFQHDVLVVAAGTGTGQAIAIAASPVLSRLYEPQDLGAATILTSAISLLSVVAALRYELAVPLPADDREAAEVLAVSCVALAATTALCALAVWLWSAQIAVLLNAHSVHRYFWLVPVGMLGLGSHHAVSCWLVRKQAFSALAVTRTVQGLSQVTTQIGLGLLGFGPLGLLVGDLAGRVSGLSSLVRHAWQTGKPAFTSLGWRGVQRAALRYRRFPLVSSWAAALNAAVLWLPPLLLARYYGLQVAGWFALAQRVLGIPLTLICDSVGKVYTAECARLRRTSPELLLDLFWRTIRAQAAAAVAIVGVVALPAPLLFALIFGSQWTQAGWYLLVLSGMFVAKFIAFPVAATLDVMECQGLHVLREVIRLLAVCAAVALGVACKQGPLVTIGLLSVASSVAYFVGTIAVWHVIRHCEANHAA